MRPGQLSDIFKALGNPHRLQIFLGLCDCSAEDCERTVGEIAAACKLAPSTVSHHLKELRQAGLVTCERQGQRVICRLNVDALEGLSAFVSTLQTPEE